MHQRRAVGAEFALDAVEPQHCLALPFGDRLPRLPAIDIFPRRIDRARAALGLLPIVLKRPPALILRFVDLAMRMQTASGSLRIERNATILSPGSSAKGIIDLDCRHFRIAWQILGSTVMCLGADCRVCCAWSLGTLCLLKKITLAITATAGSSRAPRQPEQTLLAARSEATSGCGSDENAACNSWSLAPWMTAKGDGLAFLVAAIWIAAIALSSSINDRWRGSISTQRSLTGFSRLEHRHAANETRAARALPSANLTNLSSRGGWAGWQRLRPVRPGKTHPPGAADRGVAGISGLELRIDGFHDFRIGHAFGQDAPSARPNARPPSSSVPLSVPVLVNVARRRPLISDIPK